MQNSFIKFIFFSLVFIFSTQRIISQDWTTFNISGFGKISIPPTLELRDKDSYIEKFSNVYRVVSANTFNIKIAPAKLVFQPIGLNEKSTSKNYSRILIFIKNGKLNEYPNSTALFKITNEEKKLLEKYFRTQCESDANKVGMSILKFLPTEIIDINGASALKYAYTRRLGTNPVVYVEIYKIFNNKTEIEITISYRVEESEIWAKDFSDIIKKIHIQKNN